MAKKELKKILLKNVPNGYSLTVEGTECMYFNETDMLAGFLTHVGLCETANMDRGTILSTLFSAMLGEAYATDVSTLKQRVGLLTSQYNTTIERMDKAIEYVTQAEKTISGLINRIEQIEVQLKATEADHAKNKKVVDETSTKLADIQRRSEQTLNSLANTATILKSLEESAESAKGNKASKKGDAGDEDGKQPSKSKGKKAAKDKDAECDGSIEKVKGKSSGRKRNDEAILNAIKAQAEKNPNIK